MQQPAPKIAIMLQGGGALGAYHIGAYQALAEHALLPNWVAGISIGAINAAIIAGNHPAARIDKLAGFWEAISWIELGAAPKIPQSWHMIGSTAEAFLIGQPNFFVPRMVSPYLAADALPTELSFYDTSPLRATLRRFVDFDLINGDDKIRLSLGATDVETGQQVFFDNDEQTLQPDHVIASGSLPPGFPATAIDGAFYWDGGCVSNTPLDVVVDSQVNDHMVVFVIDLFDPHGAPPTTMNEVLWRAKQIQYAGRTAHHVDAVATKINLRHALATTGQAIGSVPRLDIVHVIYRTEPDTLPFSDAEFSRSSIDRRRAAGYADLSTAIAARPWLINTPPAHCAALVHRVIGQRVETRPAPNLRSATDRP